MIELKKMFRIFPLRILMVIIASTRNSLNDFIPEDYCSEGNTVCINAVTNLLNVLDENYDPCNDFYLNVCKKWQDNKTVTSHGFTWDQFRELNKKIVEELSNNLTREHSTVMIQKMSNFYQSCLSRSNELYYYPETITDFLTTIGGWPLIGQDISPDYDWMEAVASVFRNTQAENLMVLITRLVYNSTREYLMLQQPYKKLIWLPETLEQVTGNIENYIKNVVSEIYPEYAQNLQILQDINATAEFCRRYMQILSDNPDSDVVQLISMEELHAQTQLDFKKFVQSILKDVTVVTDDTKIFARNMEFFRRLKGLISEYSNQMRTIASFIGMIAANQLKFEIQQRNVATPKTEFCIVRLFEYMPFGAGVLLANNTNRRTVMLDVQLITNEIKVVIENDVNRTSWIDANSKANFLRKLRNIRVSAIGPEWMDDASFVWQYYRDIGDITSDNYMRNIITLEKFKKKEKFKVFTRPLNTDDLWTDAMYLSSVYYNKYLNALYIPVLSLKPPIYHSSYNQAMKFGSLGVMIAEGMMKAFNNYNIYLDENGMKCDGIWSEPIGKVIYDDYMYCLAERLDNFTSSLFPYQVNGTLRMNENFAINMGLAEAFKAFDRLSTRESILYYEGEQKKANYKKQFFFNFAYMKCEKLSEDASTVRILQLLNMMTQKHLVTGSISNLRDFYQLFQCYLFQDSTIFRDGRGRCNFWRDVPAKV